MYVIEKVSLDKQGRIPINKLFEGTIPRDVGFAYDTERKEIVIEPYNERRGFNRRKVDAKGRMALAPWIRKEFGSDYYIVVDGERRALKTNNFF